MGIYIIKTIIEIKTEQETGVDTFVVNQILDRKYELSLDVSE